MAELHTIRAGQAAQSVRKSRRMSDAARKRREMQAAWRLKHVTEASTQIAGIAELLIQKSAGEDDIRHTTLCALAVRLEQLASVACMAADDDAQTESQSAKDLYGMDDPRRMHASVQS